MTSNQHKDCGCIEYKSDYTIYELRLTGEDYYCSVCCRYVSSKKWKGGLVHFGNRTRFVQYFQCPCCGYKMRSKRRNKSKLFRSIESQTNHPEKYSPFVLSKLKTKQSILNGNFLVPTVT